MPKTGYVRIEPIFATPVQAGKVVAEIDKVLADTGRKMAQKFEGTTSAWGGIKPTMTSELEDGAVWAGPDGTEEEVKKWRRLDEGVEPHPIVPSTGNWMVFPFQGVGRSYTASTTPRQFSSRKREKHGRKTRRETIPMHPGNAPREWSDEMIKQELDPFAQRVQAAVDKGME